MSGDPSATEPGQQRPAPLAQEEAGPRGAPGDAPVPSAIVSLSSGRRYEIEATASGDRLVVRGRDGELLVQMEISDAGPMLSFSQPSGEHAAARWEAGPSAPPRRAAWAPQSTIVPLVNAKEGPPEGVADEAIHVPRAMPLPTITLPRDAELLELDGGGARSGVTLRRSPGEGEAASAVPAPPAAAGPGSAQAPDLHGAQPALPSLSLQQYAVLCAEASVGAASSSFDQALRRHGIADRDLWKMVDRSWQDRLEREPMLTLRWMELTTRYREHLTRR
ncbi:hypothetical protein [Sorangium sp. So ce1024]|uniref:hypothetical protein n=1 Tax=Sorangium sp. So ce1024 TaxID=3133327 RepID=UPI003F0D04EE